MKFGNGCPSSVKLNKDQKNPNKDRNDHFGVLLKKFYTNLFAPSDDTTQRIARTVDNDISIMVLAKKIRKSTALAKSIQGGDGIVVVAAVSFQCLNQPGNSLFVAAFITFFGVAVRTEKHPFNMVSWRRQGFGLLMLGTCYKVVCITQRMQADSSVFAMP